MTTYSVDDTQRVIVGLEYGARSHAMPWLDEEVVQLRPDRDAARKAYRQLRVTGLHNSDTVYVLGYESRSDRDDRVNAESDAWLAAHPSGGDPIWAAGAA